MRWTSARCTSFACSLTPLSSVLRAAGREQSQASKISHLPPPTCPNGMRALRSLLPLTQPAQERGVRAIARCAPYRPASSLSTATALSRSPIEFAKRWFQGGDKKPAGLEATEDELAFNAADMVHREAAIAQADVNLEQLISSWLPPNAPADAVEKVRWYLANHPVDALIVSPNVQITHIEDATSGVEESTRNLSPMSLKEAIEAAKERKLNVVQMGERNGMSYVKLRNEKRRVLELVAKELAAAESSSSSPSEPEAEPVAQPRLKNITDHVFRDVVDAHFIGWKSKKIVEDMKKLHPVKVGVNQFQAAESAISKLREMCDAIRQKGEELKVPHHFTSINASEREVAVLFSPSVQGKANSSTAVKHPGEKEWANVTRRLQGALQKSGKTGTYVKTGFLKPRSVGATPFRVDRFGRRLE